MGLIGEVGDVLWSSHNSVQLHSRSPPSRLAPISPAQPRPDQLSARLLFPPQSKSNLISVCLFNATNFRIEKISSVNLMIISIVATLYFYSLNS